MDYRKMKDREREYRLLCSLCGNDGKVQAKGLAGEPHKVTGDV